MKTIIAGSRDITDYNMLLFAIEQIDWEITTVISGGAAGVDKLGEQWAAENLRKDKLKIVPAEWRKYGKQAGYLRNVKMAEKAEALLAIWDGKSKGTGHMIDIAQEKGLKIYVYNTNSKLETNRRRRIFDANC